MSFGDELKAGRRAVERLRDRGEIDAETAGKVLAFLDEKIKHRLAIGKRLMDRRAYRKAQTAKLLGGSDAAR